jgi:hypothetical protein
MKKTSIPSALRSFELLTFLSVLCALPLSGQQIPPSSNVGFVSVKDFGAKGDGVTDDTAAIQNALGKFTQALKGTGTSGAIFFPTGTYQIRETLILAGITNASVHLLGAPGATLNWSGAREWPMVIVYGSFSPVIEGLRFKTNGSSEYAIHLAADNAIKTTLGTSVRPGTQTVTPGTMSSIGVGTLLKIDSGTNAELVYVTVVTPTSFTAKFAKQHPSTATVGGGAATQRVRIINCQIETDGSGTGVAIGNVLGTVGGSPGSSQVSEVSIYDTDFIGGTDSGSAIVTLDGNNVGDIYIYRSRFFGWSVAVDFAKYSFSSTIDGCNFEGSRVADIRVSVGGSLTVKSVYSETRGQFITGSGYAGSPGSLVVIGSVVGSTSREAYLISYPASLILIGNSFGTLNASAKVQVGNPLVNAASHAHAGIFSSGNYYQGASGFTPFYDGSNNSVLPNYYNHQPVEVASIGDYGGSKGALVSLDNYLSASAITSHDAAFVSSAGLVRAGDTDVAVAFRDHANRADIPGLAKDGSDVVFIGGTSGIGLNSPLQAGNGARGDVQAPGKGSGTGPGVPTSVAGWVPVKIGNSTYFIPLMK